MEFSARAIIGGIGTAVLCVAFPPITAIAIPAYGAACIAGSRRDKKLERESCSDSDSSESGGYEMNLMARRSYENPIFRRSYDPSPYQGDLMPLPNFGLNISPEAVIARRKPRLAARVLSDQIAASIMETGSGVIASTAAEALRSGRTFERIEYDMVEKERLFGRITVRTHEFHGRLTIR